MGEFRSAARMFAGVSYNKFTSAQLKPAMDQKIVAVTAKIKERQGRVARLKEEFRITDAAFAGIVIQYMKDQQEGRSRMSYSNSLPAASASSPQETVEVPAGTIANLITETGLIESEGSEIERMALIVKNLVDFEPATHANTGERVQRFVVHTLTDDELRYLGFC